MQIQVKHTFAYCLVFGLNINLDTTDVMLWLAQRNLNTELAILIKEIILKLVNKLVHLAITPRRTYSLGGEISVGTF